MSVKALQDYTFVSKYARYDSEKKRRETWQESVERVKQMHLRRYPQIEKEIEWAFEQIKQKRVLGSQRALQFGGKPIEKKNARIYNCFSKETTFITDCGVKSFLDFENDDEITVLTHDGSWQKAIVKCHGVQNLNAITFKKGSSSPVVKYATGNHTWILKNGERTEELSEDDQLLRQPNLFNDWNYESASPEEKIYWAYGLVCGDGTKLKNKDGCYTHSMIRLCGENKKYKDRFEELGFKTSTNDSLNGDFYAYTGTYLKTLPDPEKESIEKLQAFTRGLLDADGTKSRNYPKKHTGSMFLSIQQSNKEVCDFIRKVFPIVGVYIVSEKELHHETNFGIHDAISFRISTSCEGSSPIWKVECIEEDVREEEVWCLEVENNHSFVLPEGIITGNCISSYCDRLRFFQECFWLLLCGCGTGFSVQKHHIKKLPDFSSSWLNESSHPSKVYVVPDTIEGWSDALGVLMSSFFDGGDFPDYEGYNVIFDFSLIRPEGSSLRSSSGKAPGPKPLMIALDKIRDLIVRCLTNNQIKLRPIDAYDIVMHASDAVLSGGVRRSATICLFSPEDEEMVRAKTGNWFNENPQRGRSNNSALLVRDETSEEMFETLMNFVREFGEPGFVWADSRDLLVNPCVEIGMYPVDVTTGLSGWQACVSGDTKLITKNENVNIKDVVGKEIEIWNGENWKKVKPFQTGSNRILYRVNLSDGSYLDCTDNHKWLVKDRFQSEFNEVETKDLLSFSNYALQTPSPEFKWNGKINESTAYELGFILGDGCAKCTDTKKGVRKPFCTLFEHDHDLGLECRELSGNTPQGKYNVKATNVAFDFVNDELAHKIKYSQGLPKEIFQWDRKSCYDFIAGWMDADGSKTYRGFRIYGRKDKILDLQLLLTKLGFYSSFNLMRKAGTKTNYGINKQDVWYIQVNDCKDLYSRRMNINQKIRKQPGKGMYQTIKSIEKLPGLHDTFCVYEQEKNQCVFNNVLTKQCNLCEINGKKCKTEEDFITAAKAAAIIGTCQAGYTDLTYLGEASKRILEREALLGVSITGMMDNPEVLFNPKLQRKVARLILKVNEEIAAKIGINPCARATCVKPAGTTSCILGTASGIHPHHANRYIRRSQANYLEPPLQHFKTYNPFAVNKSVWSANGTDEVISFCIEVPKGAKTKNDIDAVHLLEYVKLTQKNWVTAGTRENRCTAPWLKHNVSNTITVKEDEWDDVTDYIYNNRKYFAGISLLPITGDKDYPQAPFTAVYTPSELVKMYGDGSVMASGLIVDGLHAFDDNLWKACDAALSQGELIKKPEHPNGETLPFDKMKKYDEDLLAYLDKVDWIRRARQFAERYFAGDVKKMTYALKDVNNWKTWCDLKREYQDVDYTQMIEETDQTKLEDTVACAGGACSLDYA